MTGSPLYAILLDGGFVRAVLKRRLKRYPTADDVEAECERITRTFPAYELLRIYFTMPHQPAAR